MLTPYDKAQYIREWLALAATRSLQEYDNTGIVGATADWDDELDTLLAEEADDNGQ